MEITGTIIKVNKTIKPLIFAERIIPDLIIQGDYYVCFGKNRVYHCKLVEIRDNGKILIEKFPPTVYRTPLLGKRKKIIISHHLLCSDEIGLNPTQAVHNTVG